MFFSPSRAVLSAILRDEYLTSAVRTKEGDKAGSNQPPARDPVQFKLELTPNYLISYLENTGSRSTRYVSMPHPNESSILPKFLEKSDPEVTRPAFSTWPVQKSQPKAFELCTSIQIHQSAYRDQTNIPVRGRVVVLNYQQSRYVYSPFHQLPGGSEWMYLSQKSCPPTWCCPVPDRQSACSSTWPGSDPRSAWEQTC